MNQVYSNDKKAPRMKKGKFSKMVITKDLHKKFIEEFPEYSNMTWKEFYDNWLDIADKVRKEAIHNPLGIRLGSHLGELKLQYLPYKFKAIDKSTSNQLGEKVPFLNINTRGKVPKIKWERRWAVKFNRILQFYAFDETREMNRVAFAYMQENPEKLRVSRITTGGPSVWRQKTNTNEHKKGDSSTLS